MKYTIENYEYTLNADNQVQWARDLTTGKFARRAKVQALLDLQKTAKSVADKPLTVKPLTDRQVYVNSIILLLIAAIVFPTLMATLGYIGAIQAVAMVFSVAVTAVFMLCAEHLETAIIHKINL